MNNILKEKLYNYCYQIKTGKPVANIPVQNRYVQEAEEMIIDNGLIFFPKFLYEGWTTIWVFKKPFMKEIIERILELFPPEQPQTAFDHWVLGKLFGYSDEAIEKYINLKCEKITV